MIYAVIQTIQLLGRRVILKMSYLSMALVISGLFQIIPMMLILPIIRVVARPGKQGQGLPRKMKKLLPEDWVGSIDQWIINTETKTLIIVVGSIAVILFALQALITNYTKRYLVHFLERQRYILANKLFINYLDMDIFSYTNPLSSIERGCRFLVELLEKAILCSLSIVMFLMIAFILIYIYPLPGITSIAMIIISTSLLVFVIQPKIEATINNMKISMGKSAGKLADSMKAIKEIKLLGRENFFFNTYLNNQLQDQDYKRLVEKFQKLSSIVTMLMKYIGLIAGFLIALYTLSKEDLAGFAMIFMLLTMRSTQYAMGIIVQAQLVYRSSLGLSQYYKTLLRCDKQSSTFGDTPIKCKESIEFKDLYFRHDNTKEEEDMEDEEFVMAAKEEEEEEEELLPFVLENLNFKIKSGEIVGLVGRNGSGKSTILDLLSGIYIPTQGCMLIDGEELRSADRKNWRQKISYVIQKPHIISESIFYNITLGLSEKEIDHQLLEHALKLSMLDQVVEQLPKGLETQVGVQGTRISGGQAQRIVLARTLYQDCPILLLDEATRAIDAATEAEIMEKIATLRGRKTVIIVTHRVQSLRQCDKIFVVEDKKIAAEGDYETLSETSELFRLFALGKKLESHEKGQEKIPSVA